MIAQDGEQPSGHVRAGLKRIDIGQGAQQRFLHQIVRAVDIAAQRNGEGAQARDCCQHSLSDGRVQSH
jgi:hypothetical protein